MSVPIEAKIIALVDADHSRRVPALVEDFLSIEGNTVQWDHVDDFGQPLLLRLVETLTASELEAILKQVDAAIVPTILDEFGGSALHYAVLNKDVHVAQKVLDICPTLVNARDCEGCLPLHRAAKQGNAVAIPALVPSDGINTPDTTPNKWTSLHYAASSRRLEACKALLSLGADKSGLDAHSRSALDIASEHSFLDIIELLG